MGGISVMFLMGMLSAVYVFFIAVIAVLIIYFAEAMFLRALRQWVCARACTISTAVQLGFRFIINI